MTNFLYKIVVICQEYKEFPVVEYSSVDLIICFILAIFFCSSLSFEFLSSYKVILFCNGYF